MAKTSLVRLVSGIGFAGLLFSILPIGKFAQQARPANRQQQVEPQTKSQSHPPSEQNPGVVRITTQLVQVDAIVTDKKGQHIEDLSEDEFELSVDGKPQPLTFFKLIKLVAPKAEEATP